MWTRVASVGHTTGRRGPPPPPAEGPRGRSSGPLGPDGLRPQFDKPNPNHDHGGDDDLFFDVTLTGDVEGTKVRVDGRTEEWAEVVLEDGRVGWVRVEVLETI